MPQTENPVAMGNIQAAGDCRQELNGIETTTRVLGGKWKPMILLLLLNGNTRFSEIAKGLPKITYRMLSKDLKELERSGLVDRKVDTDIPSKITYELTAIGRSLAPLLSQMVNWGLKFSQKIDR